MPFDLTSAQPVMGDNGPTGGFDLSSAKPVSSEEVQKLPDVRKTFKSVADIASPPPNPAMERAVGLTARAAGPVLAGAALGAAAGAPIAGVGAIPGALAGAGAAVGTMALGDLAHQISGMLGMPIPAVSHYLDQVMTKIGLPEAKTPTEKIGVAGARGIANAAGGIGLGSALSQSVSPAVQSAGEALQAMPGKQLVSGGLGAASGQAAANLGAGPLGQTAATLAGGTLPFVPNIAATLARGTAPVPTAKSAVETGYTLPPKEISGTQTNDVLSSIPGQAQLRYAAVYKNQPVTNSLAQRAVGLPADTPLTDATFDALKAEANKGYEAVSSVKTPMTLDSQFSRDISKLGQSNSQAAQQFPGSVNNTEILNLKNQLLSSNQFTTDGALQAVRQLRFDAKANLKNFADPNKQALGFAQKQAADAIDSAMERGLQSPSVNAPANLVADYKNARVQLAKIHNLESVTNTETGDVNANALARLWNSGAPLTGELQKIARTATAYPKYLAPKSSVPSPGNFSVTDLAQMVWSLATGHPGVAGAVATRPAIKGAILSRPYQQALVGQPQSVPAALPAIMNQPQQQ